MRGQGNLMHIYSEVSPLNEASSQKSENGIADLGRKWALSEIVPLTTHWFFPQLYAGTAKTDRWKGFTAEINDKLFLKEIYMFMKSCIIHTPQLICVKVFSCGILAAKL